MNEEVLEILKKLGFEESEILPQRHTHKYAADAQFDFSANSIEGIVSTIYWKGREDGEKLIQKEIKELLGVK